MASCIRFARSALLLAAVAATGPSAVVPVDARLEYDGDSYRAEYVRDGSKVTSPLFRSRFAAQMWIDGEVAAENNRQEGADREAVREGEDLGYAIALVME